MAMGEGGVGEKVDVLTESLPTHVWIQVDVDGDADDRSEAVNRQDWMELSWHYESIGGQEVEYVRTDLVAGLIEAASRLDARGFFDDVPYSPDPDLAAMKADLLAARGRS